MIFVHRSRISLGGFRSVTVRLSSRVGVEFGAEAGVGEGIGLAEDLGVINGFGVGEREVLGLRACCRLCWLFTFGGVGSDTTVLGTVVVEGSILTCLPGPDFAGLEFAPPTVGEGAGNTIGGCKFADPAATPAFTPVPGPARSFFASLASRLACFALFSLSTADFASSRPRTGAFFEAST